MMHNVEKFDILIYTAMNNRHTISRLWCISIKSFIEEMKHFKIKVLAVVSEQESVDQCKEFGFDSVLTENKPLGRKFNYGLETALKAYDFEYMILMGDDDIFLPVAWQYYTMAISDKVKYGGLGSLYFWNPKTRQTLSYSYIDRGMSDIKLVGCGRLIHREAINAAGWYQEVQVKKHISKGKILGKLSPGWLYSFRAPVAKYLTDMKYVAPTDYIRFELWDNNQNSALDKESEIRLILAGYMPELIAPVSQRMIVDIKSGTNIWPYDTYIEYGEDVNEIEVIGRIRKNELQYVDQFLR